MSKHYCCVPRCVESGDSHLVLHVFPNPNKYPDRFRSWVMAVGGDILGLDNQFIYTNRRVCHRHFEDKDCCRNNRLSQFAVPRKNLPGLSTIPQFTFGGQRHLKSVENIGQHLPSTSKDKYDLFGPEFSAESHRSRKRSAPNTKENEHLTSVQSTHCDTALTLPTPMLTEEIPVTHYQSTEKTHLLCNPSELLTSVQSTHGDTALTLPTPMLTEEIPVTNYQSTEKTHQLCNPSAKARQRVKTNLKRFLLTPKEGKFYKKLRNIQLKLSRFKNRERKHLKTIKMSQNLMTNKAFVDSVENMPNAGKILTLLQFREQKKKSKGRRFTLNEKIASLSVYKQSPKAYRFLRKMFLLPASQTLDKLIQKIVITPGINQKVFSQLEKKSTKMKADAKLCVLLLDEVALQPYINYNEYDDKINGLVEEGSVLKFADHAVVFMLRGLLKNYKQPIAYAFCSGATKAFELKKLIQNIVTQVTQAGFVIVATVCDQGSNNQKTIKSLIEDTRRDKLKSGVEHRRNTFFIEKTEIIPLYDPPHLLKGMRNNLLDKALKYKNEDGKICTAKWGHHQMLYTENPAYKGARPMPKLTDQHVVPEKIGKMKVKFASQIFSHTVASNMGYLAAKGILPVECEDTADLLLIMDQLFDSMNGSYGKKGTHAKPYLGALTPRSPHHKLWRKAKRIFRTMEFVNNNNKVMNVPTLKNYIWTIEGLEYLSKKMADEYEITSIWTRHLNQDPLEFFFGSIRSHGCRNNNPSPAAFQSSFTALMINNLTSVHAAGANCEEDFCVSLQAYITFPKIDKANHIQELNLNHISINPTPLHEKKGDVKLMSSLTYISGFFLKKCKDKIIKSCKICNAVLFNKNKDDEYLKKREYSDRGWLCYPNKDFIYIISQIQDIIYVVLRDSVRINYIKEYIKTVIATNVDMLKIMACETHKDNLILYLNNYVVRFFLIAYCKDINKILQGRRKKDCDDPLQCLAEIYNKKSFKGKKK